MKKVALSFFLVAALVVTMSVSALAATTSDGSDISTKVSSIQANKQKLSDKIASIDAKLQKLAAKQFTNPIRQKVNEDAQNVMSIEKDNLTSLQQVDELRLAIQQKIATLKQSGTKIPDEVMAQVKDYNSQIRTIMGTVKDSNGQIKSLAKTNKNNLKNKDLQAVEDTFAQISKLQSANSDQIAQVTGILHNMNDLLQTVQ